MTYNYSMVSPGSIRTQSQNVLCGIDSFPFDKNVLINTNKLAQAEQRIGKIAEPMFHHPSEGLAEVNVCVTGVALEHLKLFGAYYSTAVFIRSAPLESYHILVPLTGSIESKDDAEEISVKPGTAILCTIGTSLQLSWAADCLVLIAIIPKTEFDKVISRRSPALPPTKPSILKIDLSDGTGKSFANLLNCLCIECNNLCDKDTIDSISSGLQELLLLALSQIYLKAHGIEQRLKGTHKRRQGVARAIDFIHKNSHRSISLTELSKVAFLSPRSLQTGFNESFSLGPMTYSKYLRLAKAHEALSKNSVLSITDAAQQHGFDNPGTFSQLYKKRYGEFPSVTLRKALTEKS